MNPEAPAADGARRARIPWSRVLLTPIVIGLIALPILQNLQRDASPLDWLVSVTSACLLVLILAAQWNDWRRDLRSAERVAALAEASARASAVLAAVMDGVVILTPDGRIESANPAAGRMFGHPAGLLAERDFSSLVDLTPQHFADFVGLTLQGDPASDNGATREVTGRRSNGSTFPAEVALRGLALPGGLRFVAIVRDVSERRRSETLKEAFVSTVSHELRTPLTSIVGALELLKAGVGGVLPEGAGRLIRIAEANSTRLARLIDTILDLEKFEEGRATLRRTPQNLNDIAARAVEMMGGLAEKRGVQTTTFLSDATPIVQGDADRLLQILTNLLSNALHFSETGGSVEVRVSAMGDRARVAVVDHSAGVPEDFRPRLFQKFAQADGADARSHAGTGLGLAIAREIAERHEGSLGFAPTEGGGASFFLDLPLSAASPPVFEDDASMAGMLREKHGRIGREAGMADPLQ